ncbi:MAG: glycoside hydrolase family 25 protein [Myxococcales bacterium]
MRRFALLLAALWACQPDSQHPGVERGPMPSSALTVCADGGTVRGVDISHYEGVINWTRVAAAGEAFGITKATEGVTFKDPMFASNWPAIKSAGLVRGAYHFFRPADSGIQQADFFLRTVDTFGPGDLPPILDWEVTDSVSNAVDVSEVQDFVDEIRARTGLTTILYTSARFLGTVGNPTQFSNLPLWDANWNVTCPNIPSAWPRWTFWQYADNGIVSGIDAGVDVNYFNGSLADLQAMTGPGEPTTPDAGVPDAGADAGSPDAGDDAGSADDAGFVEDAGSLDDAGVRGDGGFGIPAPDAGPGPIGAASVGCTSAGAPGALLFGLLALWLSRRRRSTSAAAPRCSRPR